MVNRREFINKSIKGTAGLFAISVIPAGLAACSNEEKIDTSSMVNLGPLNELKSGVFPKKVTYKTTVKDAWTEQNLEGFVYININKEDDSLLIMSPICTHLGCSVGEADKEMQKQGIRFYCPCHGGQYDENGINVGGPPPRPFDVFDSYVQDDNVYIAIFSPIKSTKDKK